MRQLLYQSRATGRVGDIEIAAILDQSRHNNAIDGITGLLWTSAGAFLQVLEGPSDSVHAAMARIRLDPRHCDIIVLSDADIAARQFGDWTMAHRGRGQTEADITRKLNRVLARASATINESFRDMVTHGAG